MQMFLFPPTGLYPLLQDEDEEKEIPTWPPAGTSTLEIKEECQALFYSATWVIRARVNGTIIQESESLDNQRTADVVSQWARSFIMSNYAKLRAQGVDAEKEYVHVWGGSPLDF